MQILEMDQNRVPALDAIGELLANLGDTPRAIEAFTRSVQLCPDSGALKYFYLGELLGGNDALQAYRKCLLVMQSDAAGAPPAADGETLARMVSVYCLIGELFMTDLAFEETAEDECEKAYVSALQINPNSVEALTGKGTFHRMRMEIDEAKQMVLRAFEIIDAVDPGEELDDIAPLPLRMRLAENLVELQLTEESLAVLSTVLEEDEEDIQAWFLTGCCHMVAGDQKEAMACVKQAKRMMRKNRNEIDPNVIGQWTKTLSELEGRIRNKSDVSMSEFSC
jgi:tetratricopeptide (TPR) repeat protein